ncbi:Phosphoenolpyruvate carboxylase kinase 1 [Dichanthelium oligosanthes]|uniref:Phosphoenolpyruvate carboxylase kinase 1 n=1 Tax=Dichanthelium oligosanthes TaxID=888268 RepID=A0A1E5V7M2_9POAL|nr:Phosphoenolpyruvate carboxylase kinase 1 [Dichanthelium oligosanthes]
MELSRNERTATKRNRSTPMSEQLKRDYEIGEEIGRGRFGVVHRCASRATGEPFAVKSVDRSALADDLDRALAELEPKLARLAGAGGANPGVVQVRAVYEDEAWTHTVMDLCTGPDLLDWLRLRRGAPVPEPDAARVVAQLAEALAGCHRAGVVHRDVKPDNVLLDLDPAGEAPPRVRLADFGSAAWLGGEGARGCAEGLVGTPHYVAPEVVAGGEYGEKVDVWGAGVVAYALLSGGALPFGGETPAEVFAAVLRGGLRFPPALFAGVSPAAKDLMRRMMCRDASRRLSAEQVLRHPWIQSGGGAREVVRPT